MQVRDAMSTDVLTIGPNHTLREAATRMSVRKVGAAVVLDPDHDQPGILTERDILDAVGAGQNVDTERVHDHLTSSIVVAAPEWPLTKAATAMVAGGFRHLVVCHGQDVIGMLSVRDIVRVSAAEPVSLSET
jgi:CBS domain-containing protein